MTNTSEACRPFSGQAGKAIHKAQVLTVVDGSTRYVEQVRHVNVMAVAGKYAMVRRPRCVPYVATVDQLFALEKDDLK